MAVKVIMPKLGLTMMTGTVVQWYKKEGDAVRKGEDLLDISTEKITNTIECPADGILLKILAPEETELSVGALLAYVGAAGECLDTLNACSNEGNSVTAHVIPLKTNCEEKITPVVPQEKVRIAITPVAKTLAKELNINYEFIVGTGPRGRITREDVEKYAVRVTGEQEKVVQQPTAAAFVASPTYEIIPYTGMRKNIGENMSRSWNLAPKITEHVSVDVSNLVELRLKINKDSKEGEIKVTVTDLLVKLVACALQLRPNINVSLADNNIKVNKDINIGVAVALDSGLTVPVIKNANKKNIFKVSQELKELANKAQTGKLSMDEISGGTFTISNLGVYGSVDFFTPIINQPESAILGVGRIIDTPVAVAGQIVIRPMMGLSLSFDHRVIDGAPAAEFLKELINFIDKPLRVILSNE